MIGGNLPVQAGNGVNDLAARPVLAAIAGNASFYLGNGNNLVTLGATSSIGGVLNVVTGNGDNTLTLAASQTYVVNAIFGSGNDTLVLGDGASTPTLTGYVNAGGGSNTPTVNSGTPAPDLTLIGF
ncbi:MAG: hypothetical protein U0797_20755 [Gemmataceae bacterium]